MMRFNAPAGEEWQSALLLPLEAVKNEARKIRDQNVSRYLIPPSRTREVFDAEARTDAKTARDPATTTLDARDPVVAAVSVAMASTPDRGRRTVA
jgi:hypothetical protein